MAEILFATNRMPSSPAAAPPFFTDQAGPEAPGALSCGRARLDGISPDDPDSGRILGLDDLSTGDFSAAALAPLLASQHDVLVFVHGTDNSFQDAAARAAHNKAWLAAADLPGLDTVFDVILFTWPACSYRSYLDLAGAFSDYRRDEAQADLSPYHFRLFLDALARLQPRLGNRRLHLLCHSMGNRMLGAAVGRLFAAGAQPAVPRFDTIVLAAADEREDTLHMQDDSHLTFLWRLGRQISVYFSAEDALMQVSATVNGRARLGFGGGPFKSDLALFPEDRYAFIDCLGVDDAISHAALMSHQYYRNSPTVRADIVATFAGAPTPRRLYDPARNVATLFPRAVAQARSGPGMNA